ncbi:PA14 domain-containing protein [Hymenobacter cellulosivorans]|uniref:PA14 domain-containing protein n=1 Tax=Hymenobacter cellulosivorans TaxID=2932249 RepID=A0ABY4FKF5_9BACT|nr:PA14 domain-containing protein [Hymenobacter cellulosivorans]UOQ55661.1 PA14 domain-containing protein [Hymenobacter cellulosivorans]
MLLLTLLPGRSGWAQSAGCSGTDPGGQPAAAGLYAEFYPGFFSDNNSFFTDNAAPPRLTRIEPQVNFADNLSFGNLSTVATGPVDDPDNFTLRLRGSISIPTTGQYTFYLTSDDASFLWLDGAAVALPADTAAATIKNGGYHPRQEKAQTVTLTSGAHSLLIHYGEATGDNILVLEYEGPGITRQPVPASLFCTATQPPRPPQALAYFPTTLQAFVGSTKSSAAPTVTDGGSAVTNYALMGPSVAGIAIEPTTGVISMAASTPLGTYNVAVAVTNANGTSTFRNVLTVDVIVGTPPGCNGLDPAGNSATSGLYAEYYSGYFNNSVSFFGAAAGLARIEPLVNFAADGSFGDLTGVAAAGTPTDPDEFSAQLRGSLRIATPGFYTFYLTSDDASYLWLDNAALGSPLSLSNVTIDNGGLHAPQTRAANVYLAAGLHNVRLLYGDATGGSTLVLEYEGPGVTRQVVPTGVLCSGIQPLRDVVSNLSYSPKMAARVVGTTGVSPLPGLTSSSAVAVFVLANAAALPAGITIDADNGRLAVDGTVPLGSYSIDVAVTNAAGNATFQDAFVFTVAPAPPAGCNQSAPNGSPPTAGLYGEYYTGYFDDDPAFFETNTPLITRLESGLNYGTDDSWGNVLPPADNTLLDPDHYSARYRGSLALPTAGEYTFYLTSDDASYLWLDNAARVSPPRLPQAAINNGGRHGPTTQSVTLTLAAGLHDFVVLFGEDTGANRLVLEYEGPGIARQVVPGGNTCTAATGVPLPVQLVRFEATAAGGSVTVDWASAQEVNSLKYVVERSRNGVVFELVESRPAIGSSSQLQRYRLTDRAPLPGLSYYRLRQVDKDGKESVSPVAVVQVTKPNALTAAVFPNPNHGSFAVRVQQTTAEPARLELVNLQGQVVYRQQLPAAAIAEYDLRIPGLATGLYQLRLTAATGVVTQKVVIE